jgi:hypothetical protein
MPVSWQVYRSEARLFLTDEFAGELLSRTDFPNSIVDGTNGFHSFRTNDQQRGPAASRAPNTLYRSQNTGILPQAPKPIEGWLREATG